MIYTYPDYYKKFNCIADKCPDTCCGKWQIVIDDDSLERYQEYDGDYRPELHRKVNWKEGVFRHGRSGKCAFLRDDMLCDMYIHMGKDSLCTTCREYPRHTEEFENVREISLSLSCPEVARILMNITDKVTFVTEEDDEDEVFDDFDYFLFTALMDTRDMLIDIIQDRAVPMQKRLWKLLAAAHDFQLCVNKNELFKWEEMRKRHEDSGYGDRFCNKIYSRINADNIENSSAASACVNTPEQLFKKMWKTVVPEMEVLRPGWQEYLKNCLTPLYNRNTDPQSDSGNLYSWQKSEFDFSYPDWQIQEEQLLVYWIYTYFCGAVYDDEIFAKVKMAVVCTLFIHELNVGTYLKNNRQFKLDDQIRICYQFSRELEHSDLNLNRFEELMSEKEIFSFENLLKIC